MCCQNDAKSGSWEGNTDRWWRTLNQALPFQNPEKVVLVGCCSPSNTLSHVCAMANWWLYLPSLLILCMYACCGQSGWDQILICCLEICIFRRQSIFPTCSSYLLLDLAWRKPLLFNSILDLRKITMKTNLRLWKIFLKFFASKPWMQLHSVPFNCHEIVKMTRRVKILGCLWQLYLTLDLNWFSFSTTRLPPKTDF